MEIDLGSDDEKEKVTNIDIDNNEEDVEVYKVEKIRGPVPSILGNWGSCIRRFDPSNNYTSLDWSHNEAALFCASVRFHSKDGEHFAVGTFTQE
jgi:splicing factor 3B subunit 3